MPNVLILFQTDTEPTEQLALALAVGAVEREALIRLRRLTRPGSPAIGHQAYGTLAAPDLAWADTVAVLLEAAAAETPELAPLFDLLQNPIPDAKRACILPPAPESLLAAFHSAGFAFLPPETPLTSTPEALHAAAKQTGHRCAAI